MLNNSFFYHRSIRKVVVTFGGLFNDIEIVRFLTDGTPKERFKVPLSYSSKENYITRITSDPNLTKSISTLVPRMAFLLNGMSYDATRKQISTLKNFAATTTGVNSQYVPVPYDFDFTLSIFVRNTEDGAQILEQILPFFTPDYTPTVDFIPEMNYKYDIPIILNSTTSNVEFEGGLADGTTRLITWDLNFTAKGYIWPPTKSLGNNVNGGLIHSANVNISTASAIQNNVTIAYNVVPNPINALPEDNFGFTETIIQY